MAFKHFKHLNVPDSWERYFSKYPQGMSILEALFEWVSQVDSMVDNQNKLNGNVEQFRAEIDTFVERFDGRLQTEVTQTLNDWQNSGFLDVVISEALQWEFDDYKTSTDQQFAQKENFIDEPLHFYVGENQKHKTINSAYSAYKALNDLSKTAVIHIYKGVYNEKIIEYNKVNVVFIGEEKNSVIWKTTTGRYADAPVTFQGNITLKNLTIIADHSDNPSYEWNTSTTGAYAVHVVGYNDFGGSRFIIDNCVLRSYQNAGLGSGTGDNHTIEVINSEIYNHSKNTIGGESLNNGALLYHSSATNGVNQKLIIKNTKIHSDNGHTMMLQTYGNNDDTILLEALNVNTSTSNPLLKNADLVKFKPDNNGKYRIVPTRNSTNNNSLALNSTVGGSPITSPYGDAILVTDFNAVEDFSLVRGSSSLGTLNLPATGNYVAMNYAYQHIETVAYQFQIQYAWNVGNNFKKYKRIKNGGVWEAWVECFEDRVIESNILPDSLRVADFNNVTTAKFVGSTTLGTLNTPPSTGFYVGEEISFSQSYRVQYAWAVQDEYKKYKRSKTDAVWTGWALVNE